MRVLKQEINITLVRLRWMHYKTLIVLDAIQIERSVHSQKNVTKIEVRGNTKIADTHYADDDYGVDQFALALLLSLLLLVSLFSPFFGRAFGLAFGQAAHFQLWHR